LDSLTNAVAQSFSPPSLAPPRSLIDVAIDFERASDMLIWARERNDTIAIEFYEAIRQHYISEQSMFAAGNIQPNNE
jgi:hypothetical protein